VFQLFIIVGTLFAVRKIRLSSAPCGYLLSIVDGLHINIPVQTKSALTPKPDRILRISAFDLILDILDILFAFDLELHLPLDILPPSYYHIIN